tara:strand:+ start:2378 stop:2545 length:168 start_codon:yes stop_codon:yes gene_type:complete
VTYFERPPRKLPFFIKLKPSLMSDLREVATLGSVTMTSIIEKALTEYLKKNKGGK